MPTDQEIADVFQKYVDGVTGDDVEVILDLYADDAVVEDPVGTPAHVGKEALREFYQKAVEMVELMTIECNPRVRAEASVGACAMRAYPRDGNGMYIEVLDVMTFNEEGKVTTMSAYWGDSNLKADN